MKQLIAHVVHIGRDMGKELVIALAQVVQTRLAVGCPGNAVLRALAIAGKEIGTTQALHGQAVELALPEGLLARAEHHGRERLGTDIAKPILWVDKVVAGIDIAIMLHHPGMSATAGHRADAWRYTHPIGQGGIEELDEVASHVVPHPLVEDSAVEAAPLLRTDGVVGQLSLHLFG